MAKLAFQTELLAEQEGIHLSRQTVSRLLNRLGEEGTHPDFDAWYQEARYAQGPEAPATLEEASELRYKDVLNAARVFNQLKETARSRS